MFDATTNDWLKWTTAAGNLGTEAKNTGYSGTVTPRLWDITMFVTTAINNGGNCVGQTASQNNSSDTSNPSGNPTVKTNNPTGPVNVTFEAINKEARDEVKKIEAALSETPDKIVGNDTCPSSSSMNAGLKLYIEGVQSGKKYDTNCHTWYTTYANNNPVGDDVCPQGETIHAGLKLYTQGVNDGNKYTQGCHKLYLTYAKDGKIGDDACPQGTEKAGFEAYKKGVAEGKKYPESCHKFYLSYAKRVNDFYTQVAANVAKAKRKADSNRAITNRQSGSNNVNSPTTTNNPSQTGQKDLRWIYDCTFITWKPTGIEYWRYQKSTGRSGCRAVLNEEGRKRPGKHWVYYSNPRQIEWKP